jgi:probable addiction module antidote protein
MIKVKVRDWDASEFLGTEEDIADYLDASFESGDIRIITLALGNVAKARGMSEIAREAGVNRESLYKSLAATGNPSFSTILKVMNSLGVRLAAVPAK